MIPTLPIDKQIHFLWGACIGLALTPHWFWVVTFSLIIGIGKELYDELSGKGTPELNDALAVFAGTAVGVVIHLLIGIIP